MVQTSSPAYAHIVRLSKIKYEKHTQNHKGGLKMTKYEESNLNGGRKVWSLDDGFGDFKFDKEGEPGILPSFVTTFKAKPTANFNSNKPLVYIASEVDGERYVVGDYAMKLDESIQWIGGENKHADARFPIMLKSVLGMMCSGNSEVISLLMMNLPIKYDTEEKRAELIKLAQGAHNVGISYDGINFIQRSIIVEDVVIKKQPFGSICDIILNKEGEMTNKEIAKGFNVLCDIGSRTVNILTLDALEERPELTTQTNDGMYVPYVTIGKYLEDELKVLIPDGKLPTVIRDKEIRGKDISPLIERVYEYHANSILSQLDKLLINSFGFVTSIIFTGGGAEVLKPYLSKSLKGINTVFLDRYSNARGLRKYGLRLEKKHSKKSDIIVSASIGGRNY